MIINCDKQDCRQCRFHHCYLSKEKGMTKEEAVEKLKVFAPVVVDDTREALELAIEALKAEPKHGEWINRRITKEDMTHLETYGELIGYHDICSVCGFDIDNFWYATGSPQYCPNCGSKMNTRGKE